ncbi:MAG: PD-(D/E)XK nuclease family protein, partial [Flavobacteriaceae bacterium]
ENYDVSGFISNCLSFIRLLHLEFEKTKNRSLEVEQLYCFYTLFNQLSDMVQAFPYVKDIPTLQSLFTQLMKQQTIDFQGEPLEGLQIMGMLESRVLDFETVIISSVNEGILPSGKKGNSFIPFDLKKEMDLPTYKEKDAVYTYHFYRLLQRAKNVYLLYNTEPDVLLGGEMSRLLHQLITDQNTGKYVQHSLATMDIRLNIPDPVVIGKGDLLMRAIKTLAEKGFSPTSLIQYIRDPIEFYRRSILKIEESATVDETIAAKNFGTIIHNTLEELLKPFVGRYLNSTELKSQRPKIKKVIKKHFTQFYSENSIERGKNSIAYQVIVRNVENFIDAEIRNCEQHNIKLLALEEAFKLEFDIPEIPFPVRLKGKVDRIDEVDGNLRILDYKTGKVALSDMNLVSWEELIQDQGLSKIFQVLCYALLYADRSSPERMEAGVISFKNLKQGFLSFATKEKKNSRTRYPEINARILELFKDQLYTLIREICNPDIPITEKLS